MSPLVQYVLSLLLSLPAFYGDTETWDERAARMETIAHAVADVTLQMTCSDKYKTEGCRRLWPGTKKQLATLLVAKADKESTLARHIHEGNCKPKECDAIRLWDRKLGKHVVIHKSKSLWQIQLYSGLTREQWEQIEGTDYESTRKAATVAATLLSRGMNSCRTIYGAISMYAIGGGCKWSGAASRVALYEKLMKKSPEQLIAEAELRRREVEKKLQRNKEKLASN